MGVDAVIGLTGLAVGDLLGILVLAPPLLWVSAAVEQRALPKIQRIALRPLIEDCLLLGACLLLTVALWRAGLGIQPIPSLLAGAWIGLRHGRAAAWLAILAQVSVFLPWSTIAADDHTRLTLHLGLAAVVLVAWLAGSFADAHRAAQVLLDRRNRLLFQAERLKTLRAMSVAIIHEISQPLSTLAIEASHLKDLTAEMGSELKTSAGLVDRKARTLSEMVRSLRRFGGRDVSLQLFAAYGKEATACACVQLVHNGKRTLSRRQVDPGIILSCFSGCGSDDIVRKLQHVELSVDAPTSEYRQPIGTTECDKAVEAGGETAGTLAERYLQLRRLPIDLEDLRLHSHCPHKAQAAYQIRAGAACVLLGACS